LAYYLFILLLITAKKIYFIFVPYKYVMYESRIYVIQKVLLMIKIWILLLPRYYLNLKRKILSRACYKFQMPERQQISHRICNM